MRTKLNNIIKKSLDNAVSYKNEEISKEAYKRRYRYAIKRMEYLLKNNKSESFVDGLGFISTLYFYTVQLSIILSQPKAPKFLKGGIDYKGESGIMPLSGKNIFLNKGN